MKKFLLITITFFVCLLLVTGCNNNDSSKITIISTSFPGYDFARAITKDSNIEVKMLLTPGADMHSYEPTPQDIINIKKSKLFIYVGGDSDSWIDDVLEDIDPNETKIVKLMDLVNLEKEELVEGMEGELEDEYDEHVWTNPKNAIKIIRLLKDTITIIDSENESLYEENMSNYIDEIMKIDAEIRDVVSSSSKKELVVGDRFPLKYFVKEYGLKYYAAFKGCSEQTEASAKTISFLINKVKEDNINVILKMELSNGNIANTIANETGAKVLTYNSAHNISKDDFNKGITYVDIMRDNIEVLREALN